MFVTRIYTPSLSFSPAFPTLKHVQGPDLLWLGKGPVPGQGGWLSCLRDPSFAVFISTAVLIDGRKEGLLQTSDD